MLMHDDEEDSAMRRRVAPTLTIEDAGDGFMVILTGEGHDVTISLDDDVAHEVSRFISQRQEFRARHQGAARN